MSGTTTSRTTKHLIATVALLPLLAGLSGCGASGISQAANMIDNARKVQKTAKAVEEVTGQDMGVVADPLGMDARAEAKAQAEMEESAIALANAEAISAAPMAIEMRKDTGKTKVMTMRPKIAVVGYNVAALTEGKATGTARGGLFGNSQGASSTMEMMSTGIDSALVERIATAASEDLVAQLTAAGFDVVSPSGVAASSVNGVMKAGQPAVERTVYAQAGGKKKAIAAGPDGYGFRQVNSGIAKGGFGAMGDFGGNAPAKLSHDLDAVLVQPTVIFDFAEMKAGRSIGRTASSSADVQFSLSPASRMTVHAANERGGLFWLGYSSKKGATSDVPFARMGESSSKENSLEQGLGMALGMGVRKKKTKQVMVHIDPERYEALALSAARGWNAAFVEQVVAARAASS